MNDKQVWQNKVLSGKVKPRTLRKVEMRDSNNIPIRSYYFKLRSNNNIVLMAVKDAKRLGLESFILKVNL